MGKKHLTTAIGFTLVLVFPVLSAYPQAEQPDRLFSYTLVTAVGQTTFSMSHAGPSKFPALEARFGGGVSRDFTERLSVEGKLIFGLRFRRDPFNKPGQPYAFGAPFSRLDEVSSKREHYFYEVPVRFVYNVPHPKIGIKAGINYRFFMPNNDDVDCLTNRRELGLTGGFFYRLYKKVNVGVDFYKGLTVIYSAHAQINGYTADFFVRNQSLQACLEYKF